MNKIGIMQGRLSKPGDNKIQAFPWQTWEEEFEIAAGLGFDEIEFIFEAKGYEDSPWLTPRGLSKIKKVSKRTGVEVNYICADYFMEKPLIRVSEPEKTKSIEILKKLIKQSAQIGVKCIEVPMVDNSRIETEQEKQTFIECLRKCLPAAEIHNIRLGLETSLKPDELIILIKELNHPLIGLNYE